VRGGAALAVAALVLAGCSGGHPASPSPTAGPPAQRAAEPPSDAQLIDDLLRDRAEALEAGHARAYLGTATPAQRRRDRRVIARAAGLRLRDVRLDPASLDITDRRATARVILHYGIAGIRGTYESRRRVDLVKARDRWRVARVSGRRAVPPWEVARFSERRTRHFVVLAPAGSRVGDLLATLESGYDTIRARLRQGRLRRRYLVIATVDPAQAWALTSEIRGLESLAAISDATINERGPARAVSDVVSLRLLVVSSAFAGLTPEGRERTIAHELTHAALAGATSGRTPAWLVEGMAMYVSGDRRPAPPGADLASLSTPYAIARLSGRAQARAYAASSAAAFAIVDRFGRRRLLALYDAFNDPSLAGPAGPRLVNHALRRELGITPADIS
jgi:hypothetical protein